jgi:hypothetical protein
MKNTLLVRTAILLLTVFLLGACAVPATTVAPTATISATATPHTAPEFAEAAEAWRLLAAQGNLAWPGWGAARIPLLIRSGEFDLLVGHPSPPQGFDLLPNVTVADQPVYRRQGHLVPVPAATAWKVGEVWSVAVPTRAEFQQAIDAQLGQGIMQLDSASYVRAIVHEAFHAYAMTAIQGDVPNFGADVDEGAMIQQLAALPNPDRTYDAEGAAVAKALQVDYQTAHEAAADFLKLRRARRAESDPASAAYEQMTEWVEGLARYAEVALMRRADQAGETPFSYQTGTAVWQQFLTDLAQPTSSPDGFRGRYYLLGAGQAFLLDRLMPDWKTRALKEKSSLEDLLQEAIK